MSKCEVSDCLREAVKTGLCLRHYKRKLKYGDPEIGYYYNENHKTISKFIEDVLSSETEDCILWPFSSSKGYGQGTMNGKFGQIHRKICEAKNGSPPTKEHQAAHNCGNSLCVNWKHLRWATAYENSMDRHIHGTMRIGNQHHWSKR